MPKHLLLPRLITFISKQHRLMSVEITALPQKNINYLLRTLKILNIFVLLQILKKAHKSMRLFSFWGRFFFFKGLRIL